MNIASVARKATVCTVATAACVVATLGLPTGTARADTPTAVTIEATVTSFDPAFAGVWQANGAIADSGTFVRTQLHVSGSVQNSPVVGAFQVTLEFSGAHGTFTLNDELLSDPFGMTVGTWQLVQGSGAYASASGHGTSEFLPESASTVFSGVLSTST